MHGLLRDGRSWAVLVVLSLVVGLIGPFGTYEAIALLPRLAYWSAIVVGTSALGTLIASLSERVLRRHWQPWLAALTAGALAGPAIALFVAGINWGAFGAASPIDLVPLLVYCTLISMAVTLLSAVLGARPASVRPAAEKVHSDPPLLDRLPRPQRGRSCRLAGPISVR
jgi:hypothetical protein